ncbi:MAG: hypothetical protein INR65_17340, partial [Gluconacetobacter diazotrophicus]|nr:hypothetical protein [Gluconacetobacter diazotrophicus]
MLSPVQARFAALVTGTRFGRATAMTLSALLVVLTAGLRGLLFSGTAPWFLFTPAIVLIALFLGGGPALLGILLSAVAAALVVFDPDQPFLLAGVHWVASIVFVATSAGLAGIVGLLRATLRQLDVLLASQAADRAALAERGGFLSSVLASSTDCIKVLDL